MEPFSLIVELILVLVSVFLIGYPLVKEADDMFVEGNLKEAVFGQEKESVFTTLGEIEFDYQMKKLSEQDYHKLNTNYKKQAVALLKAEEGNIDNVNLAQIKDLELEVEKDIESELEAIKKVTAEAKR